MGIKWNRGDYTKLGKAVRSFNKEVIKAEAIENSVAPEIINYSELKSKINTRQELNKAINTLKRYSADNMYKNVNIPKFNITSPAVAQIQAEKKLEKMIIKSEADNVELLQHELERIKNLNKLQGYERKRKEERIKQLADIKYEYKKAYTYRQNYINTIRNAYKNMNGYSSLYKKLNSIKNPIEFYNYIKENSVSINDMDIYFQSNQNVTQEHFNSLLESWGLDTEDIQTE